MDLATIKEIQALENKIKELNKRIEFLEDLLYGYKEGYYDDCE